MAGVFVVPWRPEEEEASIRRCSVRSSNGWHQLMQRKTTKRMDAVLGGGRHGGCARTRWQATRAHDEVDLDARGSDEGERVRGKISVQGGVELTRPRGGGRLPYPLAGADEVVRRGVAPVATPVGGTGGRPREGVVGRLCGSGPRPRGARGFPFPLTLLHFLFYLVFFLSFSFFYIFL